MKTILFPTDFSKNAAHALFFAAGLNKTLRAKIILYHAYQIPLIATDIPIVVPTEGELQTASLHDLNTIKNNIGLKFPGMEFAVETSAGIAEEEIVYHEKKTNCDLVVMGTHGATGLREFIMGSTTADVIEHSVCPVLAVPDEAKLSSLHKIVFAADYGKHSFKNALSLIDIARPFNSEIILLHITQGNLDINFEYAELEGFKHRLTDETSYPHISFRLLEDADVYRGLSLYMEEIQADVLAINRRNLSFVQKIFTRSLTKRFAYHSKIPVLALHHP